MIYLLAVLVAASLTAILALWRRSTLRRDLLPPGPRALPLIGCAHLLPIEAAERKFREWGKQFGPITSVPLFGKLVVVVNTVNAARDLLEKRSSNYSDRPDSPILDQLGWECTPAQAKYGPRLRRQRKWMQDSLDSQEAVANYRQLQLNETYRLLAALVQSPSDYMSHIRKFTVALIVEMVYGHKVNSMDDPLVELAEKAGRGTSEAVSPGSNALTALVDFFPMLGSYPLWMPGSEFRRTILRVRDYVQRFSSEPFGALKRRIASGAVPPCFVGDLLEQQFSNKAGVNLKENEDDIKGTATLLYIAAADTTTAVLATFLLAMVRYPEICKTAQQEIAQNIGSERLPDFDDRPSLPYLQCIIKEIYRFTCPLPLCLLHASVNDDEYQGYYIPGESTVLPNIWGMCQDEALYTNPDKFLPERFCEAEGARAEADPTNIVFGFGRRICPGQKFADANIFLVTSNLLATMNIFSTDSRDAIRGMSCDDFASGLTRHPKPFSCCIESRSEKVRQLIEQMNASL